MVLHALIVTALTVAALLAVVRVQSGRWPELGDWRAAPQPECRVRYVYDGDTVAFDCGKGEQTGRLLGLDAPETKEPRCPEEKALGLKATERLRALVRAGKISLEHVSFDRYGRALIHLFGNGQDLGEVLIREKLAVAYHGEARIDWCLRIRSHGWFE